MKWRDRAERTATIIFVAGFAGLALVIVVFSLL